MKGPDRRYPETVLEPLGSNRWGEWGDWSKVVIYKHMEGFEELNGGVIRPNAGEVIFDVVD